ncbi:MAG TPA: 5-oxoprolinase subunit PxpB [Chloroflexia bacterium]|nr:5-oxoprolinase subunit PxpB [Chloroflexia bacterium]
MASSPGYPSMYDIGEGALIVAFGNRVSDALRLRVANLHTALREADLPGVFDVVPAYASVLVRFDPLRADIEQLRATILPLLHREDRASIPEPRHHTIPVRYGGEDGPDLAEVASLHGLTGAEVIRRHSDKLYTVYFLGFLPGFAYMGRVGRRIATPRLSTPRVRVPPGSIGIAGAQTAIYPFNSPGGWRIIGRTSMRVWDPYAQQPALFAPGDTVHFVPSDSMSAPADPGPPSFEALNPIFKVLEPGALTTIQDLGRPDYGHIGLSTGGVSDIEAALRANALVGNRPGAALLEITWSGPTLQAMRPATIALEGTDFGCRVDGTLVPPGVGWFVRGGATIKFVQMSPSGGGARAYVAVSGGFEAPTVLGSRSTSLPARFGGFEGRALRSGDILGVDVPPAAPAHLAGRYWISRPDLALHGSTLLRFVRYKGVASITPSMFRQFVGQEWRVTSQSDRIGIRLEPNGEGGITARTRESASLGVVRGAIQLPPGGNPVVLGADHQTTGGYPLLGVVAQADWPALAQLQPGDHLRFMEISREEAVAALSASRNALLDGLRKLKLGSRESDYALV